MRLFGELKKLYQEKTMNQPTIHRIPTKRIKVSKYFYLDEFIPHTYVNHPDNGLSLLDKRLFEIADLLRELKGTPGIINTWWNYYIGKINNTDVKTVIFNIEKNNSIRKWSGYRSSRCLIGAKNSAHKQGKALDMVGSGKELFKIIENNAERFYKLGVRRLEDPRKSHLLGCI